MGTKRRVTELLRKWRIARAEVKQARDARRDVRDAEELHMARDGAKNRFPPMGG